MLAQPGPAGLDGLRETVAGRLHLRHLEVEQDQMLWRCLIDPTQLQNAAIFVVFLMIVLLRPQGLFGRSAERA